MGNKYDSDIEELYSFQCKECSFVFLEPYNPSDRFAKIPQCPDCGGNSEEYDGDITEEMQKEIEIYNEENGIE